MVATRTRLALAVAAVALTFASCGQDQFDGDLVQAATDLIEQESFAQRLGIGPLTGASCDEPTGPPVVGTVMECRATSDGEIAEVEVTVEGDDRLFGAPTNVVSGQLLPDYADSAVERLNAENGLSLVEGSIDCGQRSVVLDQDRRTTCKLTDPESGTVFDVALTVFTLDTGTFAVEVIGLSE